MEFSVLGISHNSAPLEIREKVSFTSSGISDALQSLRCYPSIEECLVLSTCNRVEIYSIAANNRKGFNSLKHFLYDFHNLNQSIDRHLYYYQNEQAIRHIFRVASSLDSMIVGENQILHQVKQAYLKAHDCGSIGRILPVLFQKALHTGKKVRAQTNIGKGAVSISSAAVELAKKILKDLNGKNILILGAGKMGELTAKNLANRGIQLILVANRTYDKAVKLAEVFRGKAVGFDQLPRALTEVDIVISSTSAPHSILRKENIALAIRERDGNPLFLIDVGVPRNIEENVSDLENVCLYNVDDFKRISEKNLQERLNEAYKAEEIVYEETNRFCAQIINSFKDKSPSSESLLTLNSLDKTPSFVPVEVVI